MLELRQTRRITRCLKRCGAGAEAGTGVAAGLGAEAASGDTLPLSGIVVMGCGSCGNYVRHFLQQGPLLAQARAELQPQLTSKLSAGCCCCCCCRFVIVAFFAFIACAEMREISRRERASPAESLPLSKDYHFPVKGGGWKQAKGSGC